MKYLYVATVLSHICQFHLPYLKLLQELGNEVHVAAHNNLAEKNGLKLQYTDHFFDIPFVRNPYHPKNLKALNNLQSLIDRENYDVIVCNTPVGGVLTRIASKETRKNGTKVIYIAHGFHFYKGSKISGWIMYYPLEKYMSKLCDRVVTINEEDYLFAKHHFYGCVDHIHGIGVSDERFKPIDKKLIGIIKHKENIPEKSYVILCTGELNQNKNQIALLKAVTIIKNQIPNLMVLFAGNGLQESKLRDYILKENLSSNVKLLGYRTDMETIVPLADVIVSCSYREGMPLNIIEAMLCKKPIIASENRGHRELIHNGINGYLFQPDDYVTLANYIIQIHDNNELAQKMSEESIRIAQPYTLKSVKKEMRDVLWQTDIESLC